MTVISSKYSIPIPEIDLLSYLFDKPYENIGWPSTEPLLLSTEENQPSYSIEEIKDKTKRIGHGLHSLGAQGKRILLYGDANIHFPLTLLGAIAAGASCAVLPPSSVYHITFYLRLIGAAFILCGPNDLVRACDAACQVGIPGENVFVVDENAHDTGSVEGQTQHWSWLLNVAGGNDYDWPRLQSESKIAEAFLLCTSGTTGNPKLAIRTHYNLVSNVKSYLYRRYLKQRTPKATVLSTFKFYGTMFLTDGLLMPLKARQKTIFMPKFDMQAMLQAVRVFRPTMMTIPKHVLQELLVYENGADLSNVEFIVTGGASIPLSLRTNWQERYGQPIFTAYGMTEIGFLTTYDQDTPSTETVGDLLPNIQAMVANGEGQPVKRRQPGEIWYKSPATMTTYCNDPEKTALLFTKDGWLKSGDIGCVDEQGYLYIVGRSKDMFNLGGADISGAQIEGGIILHPDVKEACVVPVKLPGENEPAPYGIVVKKPGSKLTVDELKKWMARELSSNMTLYGGVSFIDALPVSNSANNKVDQKTLQELAQGVINEM